MFTQRAVETGRRVLRFLLTEDNWITPLLIALGAFVACELIKGVPQ